MTVSTFHKKLWVGPLALIACALIFSAPALAQNEDGPVVVAATAGSQPEEPPAKYEETMKDAMNKVFATINEIQAQEGLSVEEKQERAMEFLRNYRWGMDGKNYFWVNNLQGRMLMHPTNAQLEGQIVTAIRDAVGKLIFVEFIQTCLEKGEGFVDYLWPDPEGKAPQPKTSLVKLFKPWGWVIGTGLILETIEAFEEVIEPGVPVPDPPYDDRFPASPV
ncbi:MAG: cache domain-containing protein [Desulfobacteraceae bacterium]|jgi:signal transduction histidine kinase